MMAAAVLVPSQFATGDSHRQSPPGTPSYLDPSRSLEDRVEDLLSKLTFEEKLSLIHADSKFTTAAIPRLGIPRRWMSDGPHGVREDVGPDTWNPAGHTDDFATYMPVNICLAATWNPEMGKLYGSVIGQEARKRGKHIMLGPAINIMRTPLNGRNYEYLGEDPFLTGKMASGYIQGEQAQEVSSCLKHFAFNNQETQRNSIDVEADDRTMREIYLAPFKAAVQQGGVWSVMGAYNQFRGQHCCENDLLLNKILKGDWGFKGLVMSDWGGTHDTKEAALNGLDLEMGTDGDYDDYYLAKRFREGIQNGIYPMSLLDDKARRNIRVMLATHMLDGKTSGSINTADHQAAARKVAEEGIVLLKNDADLLPLNLAKIKTIAVIGDSATRKFAYGGESAALKAFYEVTPMEGLLKRIGGAANITYSAGFQVPVSRRYGSADAAGVRSASTAQAAAGEEMIRRAVAAARSADVAIVYAGLNHDRNFDSEGSDRKDLKLPFNQDELIRRVAAANRHTVVVLMSGGALEMDSWLGKVHSVLQAWYPGMEGGNAIAEALFGDVNPSGKLPCTFPKKLADSPAHALNAYPGKDGKEEYVEGLLVGYRWFDTKKIEPLFPFGHGLSYTKFEYGPVQVTKGSSGNPGAYTVSLDITNTGDRDGEEVVELYVKPGKEKLERPMQELKGFAKPSLKAHETKRVTIELDPSSLSYYDPARKAWVAEPGRYDLEIGSSSRDIRQHANLNLDQEILTPEG
jgi:beta-glucosidase